MKVAKDWEDRLKVAQKKDMEEGGGGGRGDDE